MGYTFFVASSFLRLAKQYHDEHVKLTYCSFPNKITLIKIAYAKFWKWCVTINIDLFLTLSIILRFLNKVAETDLFPSSGLREERQAEIATLNH
jgi:hypothetical protein